MSGPKDGSDEVMTAHEAVALACSIMDPKNDEHFQAMIILSDPYIRTAKIADAFGVDSHGTLRRWRMGHSLPHPKARIAVRVWILGELSEKILSKFTKAQLQA